MLTGIDHVVFRVADVDVAVDWYRDKFGLEAERLDDFAAGRSPFVSIRVSESVIIDLLPGQPDGTNVDHAAFVTDPTSFDALVEKLGDEIEMGPAELSGAQGLGHGIYVRDPSGNRVEIRTYRETGSNMSGQTPSPSREEVARRRAKYLSGLIWHFGTFLIINTFFWILDLAVGEDGLQWAFWITGVWAFALLFHVLAWYVDGRQLEERKTRQYLNEPDG